VNVLYSMKASPATAAVPRTVDAHSLLHLQVSKAVKACDAADLVDGLAILQRSTLRVAAVAYGVSLGSVARAKALPVEEREKVRRGQRPLVLPRTPVDPPKLPVVVPATPPFVTADVEFRLACLVQDVGLDTVLDLLARTEHRVAA
jgi:hypothetical protein